MKLKAPEIGLEIRKVDDDFVKILQEEIQNEPLLAPQPLLCMVEELANIAEFDEDKIESYHYITIGGNHRRIAYQRLLDSGILDESATVPVILVFGNFHILLLK